MHRILMTSTRRCGNWTAAPRRPAWPVERTALMNTPATEDMMLPTILAVDDTPSNLSLIAGLLKGRYRVKVANSGFKALSVVHGEMPPDLVLLDVMMPDMDGIE